MATDLLPLGTVVKTSLLPYKVCIIGHETDSNNSNSIPLYTVTPFPHGSIAVEGGGPTIVNIAAPPESITDVIFIGCACDERGEIRTITPSRTANPLRSILPLGSVV